MSMLQRVTRGKVVRPSLFLIYGPGGVGKSTYASTAPSPIFLGAERGTDSLDVARFPALSKFEDAQLALNELLTAQHDFKTLVIDTLDWLEASLFESIRRKSNNAQTMEAACGGYGKAYSVALNEWESMMKQLDALRDKRGMNIILLAHPKMETVTNPVTQLNYQRWELKLHKTVKPKFMEYVDAMFFATFDTVDSEKQEKVASYATGRRIMHPTWSPAWDAKNRFGLDGPLDLNTPWDELMARCGTVQPVQINESELRGKIEHLMSSLPDETKEKVKPYYENCKSLVDLGRLLEKLTTMAQGVA